MARRPFFARKQKIGVETFGLLFPCFCPLTLGIPGKRESLENATPINLYCNQAGN